jgi:hypothetical protein
MMNDGMIHIPTARKKREYVVDSQVVRISPDAFNAAIDICYQSGLSMSAVISMIVLQAADKITYDEEDCGHE